MQDPTQRQPFDYQPPAESRDVLVISNRVVEFVTHHVAESVWVATGKVSEPLPSGLQLQSPLEVTATGTTEQAAIRELRQRIEEMEFDRRG
jgi:hypothetical protein